jgi:hypothetical protein
MSVLLHSLHVATEAGPPPLSASFAWCSCGWKGPLRETREEAIEDMTRHEPEEGLVE